MQTSIFKHLSESRVKWLLLIVSILLLIPLILFIVNFWDSFLLNKTIDWANFGAYISGVLGTLIAFLNFCFLIYITYKLSNIDVNREKNNLKFQSLISLNELKNNSYKEIIQILKTFRDEAIIGDSRSFKKCYLYLSEVSAFCEGMSHLFPSLKDSTNYKLMLENMSILLKNIENKNGGLSQEQKKLNKKNTENYIEAKEKFIKKLQIDIISTNPLNILKNE